MFFVVVIVVVVVVAAVSCCFNSFFSKKGTTGFESDELRRWVIKEEKLQTSTISKLAPPFSKKKCVIYLDNQFNFSHRH